MLRVKTEALLFSFFNLLLPLQLTLPLSFLSLTLYYFFIIIWKHRIILICQRNQYISRRKTTWYRILTREKGEQWCFSGEIWKRLLVGHKVWRFLLTPKPENSIPNFHNGSNNIPILLALEEIFALFQNISPSLSPLQIFPWRKNPPIKQSSSKSTWTRIFQYSY